MFDLVPSQARMLKSFIAFNLDSDIARQKEENGKVSFGYIQDIFALYKKLDRIGNFERRDVEAIDRRGLVELIANALKIQGIEVTETEAEDGLEEIRIDFYRVECICAGERYDIEINMSPKNEKRDDKYNQDIIIDDTERRSVKI